MTKNAQTDISLALAKLDAEAALFVAKSRTKLLLTTIIVPLCALMGVAAWDNVQKPKEQKQDFSFLYMMGLGTVGLARTYIGMGFLDAFLSKRRLKQLEKQKS